MQNMSFAMTTDQVKRKIKTVTRRRNNTWKNLKVGQRIRAVDKAMGLKKGEHPTELAIIEVVSIRSEPLHAIDQDDCIREGFPHMSPDQFVKMLVQKYDCFPDELFKRIEFKYV